MFVVHIHEITNTSKAKRFSFKLSRSFLFTEWKLSLDSRLSLSVLHLSLFSQLSHRPFQSCTHRAFSLPSSNKLRNWNAFYNSISVISSFYVLFDILSFQDLLPRKLTCWILNAIQFYCFCIQSYFYCYR